MVMQYCNDKIAFQKLKVKMLEMAVSKKDYGIGHGGLRLLIIYPPYPSRA